MLTYSSLSSLDLLAVYDRSLNFIMEKVALDGWQGAFRLVNIKSITFAIQTTSFFLANMKEVQHFMANLSRILAKKYGLRINAKKTKVMIINRVCGKFRSKG